MTYPIKNDPFLYSYYQTIKGKFQKLERADLASNLDNLIETANSSDACFQILLDAQLNAQNLMKTQKNDINYPFIPDKIPEEEEKDGDQRVQFRVQFNDNIETRIYDLMESESEEKAEHFQEVHDDMPMYYFETQDLIRDLSNALGKRKWFAEYQNEEDDEFFN